MGTPFHEYAAEYAAHRPTYPAELYDAVAERAPRRDLLWDCACGNGQAARGLAERFGRVVATDVSWQQLAEADRGGGVAYACGSAEAPPLRDASVDVVTVAQALHWLDVEAFHAALRRVVRPPGLVVAWCYELAVIDPAVDAVVGRLYEEIVGPYWRPERRLLEQGYRTLPWPWEELRVPPVAMTTRWSLGALLGYLSTWSACHAYARERGSDPLDLVRADLAAAWGPPEIEHVVTWPLHVRAGRIDG